jgi:hypothetical protein
LLLRTYRHRACQYDTGLMHHTCASGAYWGGVWGLLFGSVFFLMAGIGPVLVAGPVEMWLIGALEGAVVVGGIGAIGAALASIRIPKDQTIVYGTEIKAGKFVVVAHATNQQVAMQQVNGS